MLEKRALFVLLGVTAMPPGLFAWPNQPRDTAAATAKASVCLPVRQLWLTIHCITRKTQAQPIKCTQPLNIKFPAQNSQL